MLYVVPLGFRSAYIIAVLWQAFHETALYGSQNKTNATNALPLLIRYIMSIRLASNHAIIRRLDDLWTTIRSTRYEFYC